MNRSERLHRPKRIRLMFEASGSAAQTANHSEYIAKQALDKTPISQRVGNYYAQIKQGVRKSYLNTVPKHRVHTKPLNPSIFAAMWNALKGKLGITKYI